MNFQKYKMKYSIQEIPTDDVRYTQTIRHYYFKVNGSKLKNIERLGRQVNKVIDRIKKKHNISNAEMHAHPGFVGLDFVNDKFTLRISIKIPKQLKTN